MQVRCESESESGRHAEGGVQAERKNQPSDFDTRMHKKAEQHQKLQDAASKKSIPELLRWREFRFVNDVKDSLKDSLSKLRANDVSDFNQSPRSREAKTRGPPEGPHPASLGRRREDRPHGARVCPS